ncbi:hypothetical protein APHAL10511_006374 [Amanita phalloides]|nr:hypothetical protein APHAL10511_006374 [Amanita phalloides]
MSEFDTLYPADSLEFCPHPQATGIFVCGTYKLNEHTDGETNVPRRQGQCLVFRVDRSDAPELGLHQIQAIDFPAVLDMKWCHTATSTDPILGVADSEGKITILQWRAHEDIFDNVACVPCSPSNNLCLSLDWSNRRAPLGGLGNLIVSVSDGSLCLLRPASDGKMVKTNEWLAHDYEPWISAWDYWDPNMIYSGGDDLALKFWDIRQKLVQPVFVNRRFDAGVTTIQSHPHVEHLIAVGSYSHKVFLFDRRKASVALCQVDVGGGVWRVKWNPRQNRKADLLVACMHDGFKVLHYEDGMHHGEIACRFDAHQSLAYGADWSFDSLSEDGKQVIGSCSFYDHRLHIWKA